MCSNEAYHQRPADDSAAEESGRDPLKQQPDPGEDGERPELVPLPDDEFKEQLGQVIPHLRAFGRSLSGSRDLADDLVDRKSVV